MQQNTISLIVGAGITLVTSILTVLLTNILQSIRETKLRTWQIEDNKRIERITLRKKRLNNIEELLGKFAKISTVCADMENEVLSEIQKVLDDDLVKVSKYVLKTSPDKIDFDNFLDKNKVNKRATKKNLNTLLEVIHRNSERREKIDNEFNEAIKNFHDAYAIENEGVSTLVNSYIVLIANEVNEFVRLCTEMTNFRKINSKKERSRVSKFRLEATKLRGEILCELDQAVFSE